MAQVQQSTNTWMLSSETDDTIVYGIESVSQKVEMYLRTQRGSVPFQPRYGIDLLSLVDQNVDVAAASISNQIVLGFAEYLPDVTIENFRTTSDNTGRLQFILTWRWNNQTQTTTV